MNIRDLPQGAFEVVDQPQRLNVNNLPSGSFSYSGGTTINEQIKPLSQRIWDSVSGFVAGVEQPIISLAAKPVQVGARALGLPDPYAEGIPAGLPGADTRAEITPATLKGTAGDILKTGALIGGVAA